MLSRSWLAPALLLATACTGTPPVTPPPNTPFTCDAGTACSQECVDLKLDSRHCGACGQACPEGYACADGTCYVRDCPGERCAEATVCLGETCVDRTCFGVECTPDRACAKGACVERNCGNA